MRKTIAICPALTAPTEVFVYNCPCCRHPIVARSLKAVVQIIEDHEAACPRSSRKPQTQPAIPVEQ